MKPNILIISFSKISSDPRVMRQIRLLKDLANVSVVGYGDPPEAVCNFISIARKNSNLIQKLFWILKLLLRIYESYYWSRPEIKGAQKKLNNNNLRYDLIIANDNSSLPLALKIGKNIPVLADAHEYSPAEFDDKLLWRIIFSPYQHYLSKKYLPLAKGMITVCDGIADAYSKNYGVYPKVITNAPTYQDLLPSPIMAGQVRMVHHGAAIRSRHIEVMIDVMRYLDSRFTLDLMLVNSDSTYMSELKDLAISDSRIKFIPPVRMEDICKSINEYDVGIYLLPPLNFNHEYALPNKLFEFIQARLAIAIGPSPEMEKVVKQYKVGLVSSSFEPKELAGKLNELTDASLANLKKASHVAANELCFEHTAEVFIKQIKDLLNKK